MNSFLLLEIKTKFEVWCVLCAVETGFLSIYTHYCLYVLIHKTRVEFRTRLLLLIKGFKGTPPY